MTDNDSFVLIYNGYALRFPYYLCYDVVDKNWRWSRVINKIFFVSVTFLINIVEITVIFAFWWKTVTRRSITVKRSKRKE